MAHKIIRTAKNLPNSLAQAHTKLGFVGEAEHVWGMMTEQNLIGAIKELESAVAAMNEESKPDLLPHFNRIDELTDELPPGTDRDLMHYLRNKSYEKARLCLEERQNEIEKGGCLR